MDSHPGTVPAPLVRTVRQRLRDGLAPLHERLDARLTEVCLSPRADTRRLLTVHAGAYPPIVAGLLAAGAERVWPEWDGPDRLAALLAEARDRTPGPGAAPLVDFGNDAAVWGGLYALLGSRLGNRLILRRLAESGEPVDSAFLRPGAGDAQEWRRFVERLETALGPAGGAGACDDAVEGAALVMRRYLDAVERTAMAEGAKGRPRPEPA